MRAFVDAFTLLTILPIPFGSNDRPPSKHAPLFFPLVGLIIGLVVAGSVEVVGELLPRDLAVVLAIALMIALTGALHVDGLADFFDGVFGGRDPESRLKIMKKPDVGAFGLTVVVMILAINWGTLSSLSNSEMWVMLPVVGLISRTAPLLIMAMTSYVSENGLGASYSALSRLLLLGAIIISVAVALVLGGVSGVPIAVAGLLAAGLVGTLAKSRLGGANGDVYGAGIELSFTTCLVTVVGFSHADIQFESIWDSI